MRVDAFDFDLPEDRIALRPARPRDSAKMLVVGAGGALQDAGVRDFPSFLRPGDQVVVNETKVMAAQLTGLRPARAEGGADPAGVTVDVTLHKRLGAEEWAAFLRPAKRLKPGDQIHFGDALMAEVLAKGEGGEARLRFSQAGPTLDAAIEAEGAPPLPPYIARKRAVDAADREDYQTVYAAEKGSVAAPTAGLHFTPRLMGAIEEAGAHIARVVLHVGAGTFLPVTAETTEAHKMHAEWGEVTAETAARLNAARATGGRIICVGTTSLRLLESAADENRRFHAFSGETDIFITPGYTFRAADLLLTHFHLPRSTLFMLVSAFSGLEPMRAAYAHAVAEGYRFYSYGDACLLHPAEEAL